jgi:hypothetical protein
VPPSFADVEMGLWCPRPQLWCTIRGCQALPMSTVSGLSACLSTGSGLRRLQFEELCGAPALAEARGQAADVLAACGLPAAPPGAGARFLEAAVLLLTVHGAPRHAARAAAVRVAWGFRVRFCRQGGFRGRFFH